MPIGASIIYNYLPYFLQTVTHIYTYNLSMILFVYGLISIVGTWIGGIIIVKNDKLTLLVFQLVCAGVIAAIGIFSQDVAMTIVFVLTFGILDGVGYNLIQYMESSLLPKTPELANGIFLSILNGGIAIGIAIGGFLVTDFGIMSIFSSGVIFLIAAFLILFYVISILKIPLKYD